MVSPRKYGVMLVAVCAGVVVLASFAGVGKQITKRSLPHCNEYTEQTMREMGDKGRINLMTARVSQCGDEVRIQIKDVRIHAENGILSSTPCDFGGSRTIPGGRRYDPNDDRTHAKLRQKAGTCSRGATLKLTGIRGEALLGIWIVQTGTNNRFQLFTGWERKALSNRT